MKIETYTGTLIHDVPDVGTIKVNLPQERVEVELSYAANLTSIGQRVQAIKHLRAVFNIDLKGAHRLTSEAAEKRRVMPRDAVGVTTTKYTVRVVDRDTSYIACDTCGFEEPDYEQTRCSACSRTFTREVKDD